jgi:hypothetical protein
VTTEEKEQKIIEWIRSFGNCADFIKKNKVIYAGINKNFYYLLSKAFPNRQISDTSGKKQYLLNMCAAGEPKPHLKKHFLGVTFSRYINPRKTEYDKEFVDKIKSINSGWFDGKTERAYKRMISMMPEFVKFKELQKWEGVSKKYTFICDTYGEFQGQPSSLMHKPWKRNLSGHPKMGVAIRANAGSKSLKGKPSKNRKKVKNLTTGSVFDSVSAAYKSINRNSSALFYAIKNKTKCCGSYWAYVDDNVI